MVETQELVERAQGGDSVAFGELYERLHPDIFRYLVRHLGGRREMAEDLTEEVFLKVLERIDRYEFRGLPFSAWLYRIARNHLIDHVRALPKQAFCSLEGGAEIAERRAELMLDHRLDQQELSSALSRLTAEQQQVVMLRFLEGQTTAETAAALEKTEDAVKKLQARGLAQLRRILERARSAERGPTTPTRRPTSPSLAVA